jgi:DNA polymerase-3 subunit epsilon/ATP-dependent DNA helicase DinG
MPNYEHVRAEVDNLLQDSQALVAGLSAAIEEDDPGRIVWLESERSDGSLTVSSAPLVVSDLLGERLFADRKSLVLTGATLRSQGGFAYIQERLGLEDAETLALGSPFDFKRAALVLTPTDMPEPGRPEYIESLGRAICELGRATAGRTLVLFTSHADLRASRQIAQEVLGREGINVLGQGIDGSARQLVRSLQSNERTILLGAASFWEGVDIPGEALSLLIIARLPFGVPTEPVTAARSALYDDAFNQYMLPQAILRFRQGFGRLIRSKTDRGVVVVLDQRIVSKRYGVEFLESLPGCGVREAALREMPDMVERWLGAGRLEVGSRK